jgi:hypothetical protein
MHKATWLLAALLAVGLTSCHDNTSAPRAVPPAAPRGLRSTTGDQSVILDWLANTEAGITGYRVYQDSSATPDGPYYRIGTTAGTSYLVTGLENGHTVFFAVSAVGPGGESDLSYDTIYDTPRPAGTGAAMVSMYGNHGGGTGWDFSGMLARPWNDAQVDAYYDDSLGTAMIVAAADDSTLIQDYGYASTLDAVDYAPLYGWSVTKKVEAIPGHCYVMHTREHTYAKFRVTSVTASSVTFDWAYQTAPYNRELRALPTGRVAFNPVRALVPRK